MGQFYYFLRNLLNRMTAIMVQFGQLCGWALGPCSDHVPDGHRDIHHGAQPKAERDSGFKVATAPDQGRHAGHRLARSFNLDNRSTSLLASGAIAKHKSKTRPTFRIPIRTYSRSCYYVQESRSGRAISLLYTANIFIGRTMDSWRWQEKLQTLTHTHLSPSGCSSPACLQ